jgi:hypothetical protein
MEERERSASDSEAMLAARARLGTEHEMVRACAAYLSPWVRFEGACIRYLAPPSTVDVGKHAIRQTIRIAWCSTLVFALLFLTGVSIPCMDLASSFTAWITVATLMVLGATSVGVVIQQIQIRSSTRYLGEAAPAALRSVRWRLFRSTSAICIAGLSSWLAAYASGTAVFAYLDRLEMLNVVVEFGRDVLVPVTLFLSAMVPLLAWATESAEGRARRLPDWPYMACHDGDGERR